MLNGRLLRVLMTYHEGFGVGLLFKTFTTSESSYFHLSVVSTVFDESDFRFIKMFDEDDSLKMTFLFLCVLLSKLKLRLEVLSSRKVTSRLSSRLQN